MQVVEAQQRQNEGERHGSDEQRYLLRVSGLRKYFPVARSLGDFLAMKPRRYVRAVDGVSFDIPEGSTFGLVGESGCGKTTTSKVILGLYKPTAGTVLFDGNDLHSKLPGSVRRRIHRNIQAVFQDPAASLDPRLRIGKIIEEPLVIHREGDQASREAVALKMLEAVGLTQEHYGRYAHELSGGQQQRVAIARALALRPRLVILDEPVSALDMSVRAQVLNLLKDLQVEFNLTYLFVAHDLSVVRYMCDRVAVMYLGRIVEYSTTKELFGHPLHPYTNALLDAVPVPDPTALRAKKPLAGNIPSPVNIPSGCRFRTRCPYVMEVCANIDPPLEEVGTASGEKLQQHYVSCHLYAEKNSNPPVS